MGYRSRAAFKLEQIIERFKIIRNGFVVVDLGCYPGGWLQVAMERVGRNGFVLGADLKETEGFSDPNVHVMIVDVENPSAAEEITHRLPRKADVVISDLAPKMSGTYNVDHFVQIGLARAALRISRTVLKSRGSLVIKVFDGESLGSFEKEISRSFDRYRRFKPDASRRSSSELYLVCFGFKT
jgi:23S rRNA (uridine2552-2'-O)-methyltransferase